MNTLDAPIFEVSQDSQWYKDEVKLRKNQKDFFKTINKEYFSDNGFIYYHSEHFGIDGNSADYNTYKEELKKNKDKNGVYIFKKKSKYYPIFKEMISNIGEKDPFKAHDVFGSNNMNYSQWVGNRWFYGVHSPELVKSNEVIPVEYKDYLQVVMDNIQE